MMRSAIIIEPVFEKMKLDLVNNETKVIHVDETTVVVNRQDEENKTRKKNYGKRRSKDRNNIKR